jgi:hypothetical protein
MINTEQAFQKDFYIACENSIVRNISEKITVQVKSSEIAFEVSIAPEFYGTLSNISVSYDFTDDQVVKELESQLFEKYTFMLPPVADINNDYCTIKFYSEKLGQTMWTNTTNLIEL